jgi:hypothetical protein
MPATLLTTTTTTTLDHARSDGENLWVPLAELKSAIGWELKPEGACRGDQCVPIPPGREREYFSEGRFNVAALARYIGQPVVHDAESETWAIGEAAGARNSALRSLEAPDFTLPDLTGRMHSLSDYRGRKVFLASWASW